jgi:hypothetical protein
MVVLMMLRQEHLAVGIVSGKLIDGNHAELRGEENPSAV